MKERRRCADRKDVDARCCRWRWPTRLADRLPAALVRSEIGWRADAVLSASNRSCPATQAPEPFTGTTAAATPTSVPSPTVAPTSVPSPAAAASSVERIPEALRRRLAECSYIPAVLREDLARTVVRWSMKHPRLKSRGRRSTHYDLGNDQPRKLADIPPRWQGNEFTISSDSQWVF